MKFSKDGSVGSLIKCWIVLIPISASSSLLKGGRVARVITRHILSAENLYPRVWVNLWNWITSRLSGGWYWIDNKIRRFNYIVKYNETCIPSNFPALLPKRIENKIFHSTIFPLENFPKYFSNKKINRSKLNHGWPIHVHAAFIYIYFFQRSTRALSRGIDKCRWTD